MKTPKGAFSATGEKLAVEIGGEEILYLMALETTRRRVVYGLLAFFMLLMFGADFFTALLWGLIVYLLFDGEWGTARIGACRFFRSLQRRDL